MTREEAIKWVERIKEKYIHGGDEGFDDARRKALDMAIEALSADTVSREQYDHVCEEYNRLVHKVVCTKLCDENCEYEKGKTCYHAREHSAIEAPTYQNLSKPNKTYEVDLISRADAMGAVQDHFNAYGFKGYYDGQQMMDRINALSSAEPKTGEWVAAHIGETTSWYVECSECHVVMPPVNYSYCPNCGADMRGDKE